MKLKSTLFLIFLFPKQKVVQFWIKQQEEKSQLGSTFSRLGWIFSTYGNSQSSSEVKDRPLAIYGEGLVVRSPPERRLNILLIG